jgi:hypothetical protein
MPYPSVTATLSDADRDKIIADLNDVLSQLPFAISLTNEEMIAIPKMGDKSVPFVEKALDYAVANPKLVPPYLDPAKLKSDVQLVKQLQPIVQLVNQLNEMMVSTYTVVGSESYVESLSFYNTVRDAAKRDVPGAKAIYEDLQKRFPGHSKGNGSANANQTKTSK